jgi:hypothetical protein
MSEIISLPNIEDLRRYVHERLCQHDHLDPAQAPLYQSLLVRRGRPVGLFFHVQGTRRLRTYAVWAAEEDRILFYDSSGLRFGETRLCEAPDPRKLAA